MASLKYRNGLKLGCHTCLWEYYKDSKFIANNAMCDSCVNSKALYALWLSYLKKSKNEVKRSDRDDMPFL